MTADRISAQIQSAISVLDMVVGWLDGADSDVASMVDGVAADLLELRLEVERETLAA